MDSILFQDSLAFTRLYATAASTITTTSSCALQFPCLLTSRPGSRFLSVFRASPDRGSALRRFSAVSGSGTLTANSASPSSGVYTVGDLMTRKEDLHVVKPTKNALEILMERRITGFPVIDDDWKLVGLVSGYDLLALDSISGGRRAENSMFPEVDRTWKVGIITRGNFVRAALQIKRFIERESQ